MPASRPNPHGVATWRLVVGLLLLPGGIGLATLAVARSVRHRLPDPMATHFAFDGHSNGSMAFAAFTATVTTMWLVLWAIGMVPTLVGRSARVRFHAERAAMAWCVGTSAFTGVTALLTVRANLDEPAASTARLAPVDILWALGLGLLGALVGRAVAGRAPAWTAPTAAGTAGADLSLAGRSSGRVVPGGAPPLEPAPHEHPVWRRRLSSTWMSAMAACTFLLGAALLLVEPVPGVALLVTGLVVAPLASITVVVDGTGLSVRFGPLAWPSKHIDLEGVAAVSAEELNPLEWGGWGYRVVPGRSAVVLRRGPAIVVDLADGRRFAVTIDDPGTGAALLEAYRRRAAGGVGPTSGRA